MSIHTSSAYAIAPHPALASSLSPPPPLPEAPACYSGDGPALAAALAGCAHGGQIVLTEQAWEYVKPAMVAYPGARADARASGRKSRPPRFPATRTA